MKSNPGRLRRSISKGGPLREEEERVFILPFEWLEQSIEETGIIPDAMIYMTDGYGLFPDDCPIPTLWIVPQSGLASG